MILIDIYEYDGVRAIQYIELVYEYMISRISIICIYGSAVSMASW